MGNVEVPVRCTGIAVILLKKEAESYNVLLLKRNAKVLHDVWCYIGGAIEEGETAWQAALREIEEETGITDLSLYASNQFDRIYSPGQNYIYMAPVFVGFVSENQEVELNDEHSEYIWATFDEAVETVSLPGNDDVLRSIEKHFARRTPLPDLKIL
ncbi:NUDIX hydrolase [Halobacillus salinus]|uniref:NUDIX hydrolase n=1 Tax=Halobacillus salinus TaxID=192814 RepID=UPI0009A62F89|nr:NUDIX domain-containing protein [Halobacillus salinus]